MAAEDWRAGGCDAISCRYLDVIEQRCGCGHGGSLAVAHGGRPGAAGADRPTAIRGMLERYLDGTSNNAPVHTARPRTAQEPASPLTRGPAGQRGSAVRPATAGSAVRGKPAGSLSSVSAGSRSCGAPSLSMRGPKHSRLQTLASIPLIPLDGRSYSHFVNK